VASKQERYSALVKERKAFDPSAFGLTNPSKYEPQGYDSDEIGPWTLWAGDLDADLMVVGQDWGDENYFKDNHGMDKPNNPTTVALSELLAGIGKELPSPPPDRGQSNSRRKTGVFLTNALLWLKSGGMRAKLKEEWFDERALYFLREQIAIVEPRVVVGLGRHAYNAILRAYGLPVPRGPLRTIVEASAGRELSGPNTLLFGVYHCGAYGRNINRLPDEQRKDWQRIGRALKSRK
jgi:uracil-DNA glycosylase